MSELFVNAFVSPLQDGESSLLGVTDGKRLGDLRRIDLGDQLLHLSLAQRAQL